MGHGIEMLKEDHSNMRRMLAILDRQADLVEAGDAFDARVLQGVADYFLSYPDQCHHPREDVIFLKLKIRNATAAEKLAPLLDSHDELTLMTRQFSRSLVAFLMEGSEETAAMLVVNARAFALMNRRHMDAEEKAFFPAIATNLNQDDWAEIDARCDDRQDPVFGDAVDERFDELHDLLISYDMSQSLAALQ